MRRLSTLLGVIADYLPTVPPTEPFLCHCADRARLDFAISTDEEEKVVRYITSLLVDLRAGYRYVSVAEWLAREHGIHLDTWEERVAYRRAWAEHMIQALKAQGR